MMTNITLIKTENEKFPYFDFLTNEVSLLKGKNVTFIVNNEHVTIPVLESSLVNYSNCKDAVAFYEICKNNEFKLNKMAPDQEKRFQELYDYNKFITEELIFEKNLNICITVDKFINNYLDEMVPKKSKITKDQYTVYNKFINLWKEFDVDEGAFHESYVTKFDNKIDKLLNDYKLKKAIEYSEVKTLSEIHEALIRHRFEVTDERIEKVARILLKSHENGAKMSAFLAVDLIKNELI